MRIEVSHNFSTVDIYKGEQLVSAIDLDGSVIEAAKELTDLLQFYFLFRLVPLIVLSILW